MRASLRRLHLSVLPVYGRRGPIGTAVLVADGLALTALHVVAPEDPDSLRLGTGAGLLVGGIATLPLADFPETEARRSRQRDLQLVGNDLGTVDLALLAVPGLRGRPLRPRATPLTVGEHVTVPSYPGGRWSISRGPVVGVDDADFAAHLLLGPGASGAPALDQNARVAGVVTLDHESATICIGPRLLTAFLNRYLAVPT